MFDRVPIQKRLKYILGLMCFVFLISLFYASQVWEINGKVDELKRKTSIIEDADLEIINRQVRLKELSNQIRGLQGQGKALNSHIEFIQYVEDHCHDKGLQLVDLPIENIQDIEGYQIAQIDFSVEGMYHDILGLIYQIEQVDAVGSIAQAKLELRTIRVRNEQKQILVGSIRVNRLLNQMKSNGA